MMKIFLLLFLALWLHASMEVAVSIAPERYFLKQIMGEDATISVLVPSGSSPASYAPKPSQLRALKSASIYFTIGVGFEKSWLTRFKSINKEMQIVDVTSGIQKRQMGEHDHAHHHDSLDPHIWLSPKLVLQVTKNIYEALKAADPSQGDKYEKNYLAFIARIKRLDVALEKILLPLKEKSFIVFHPSFGYFAQAYNLNQVAIEREGKEPSLRHIKRIIDYAKDKNIKTIFIAPQFSQKAAEQIASQVKAKVVTINPLSEDWEENLLQIARSFETANRD